MANWDHRKNIGTHPVLSDDPEVRRPHIVAAAEREIARFAQILDQTQGLKGRTVHVTIGRNVGDSHMPLRRWEEFQILTRSTLFTLLSPDFSAEYRGTGRWHDVSEDSTTYVCSGITSTTSADALRLTLESLARKFDQDAIALTIGTCELVAS